ncbi:MAG: hypothetical protein J0I36_14495 [Pandoraea sp.]|uniref:hypothetical protein n=1 Tax=Pandoraea sp. 64-18 TaxID=1895806 RepID=UPI0009637AE0|nr:hypothetical protein [Pandoraea sp. 64-18]MBN9116436.1 hypothetical protein [Pandoraea sp.]OJY23527.1 MAG: hypothetical protein BGP02_04455 [Pandoraea sp. 64-18]
MSDVTQTHEEKETLSVDVLLPGHVPRTTTALFTRTRKALIEREAGRCFVCGGTDHDTGHPLEAHHSPIERSTANLIDWSRFAEDCRAGVWGARAQAFDWDGFLKGAQQMTVAGETPLHPDVTYLVPADPYLFIDDMTVNGLLLCRDHHIGKDEGIHAMPFPLWVAQKYAIEGYRFTPTEIIHHHEKDTTK